MANEIPREYVGSGEQPSRGFTCVKASIHIVQYSVHCQISRAGSAKPQYVSSAKSAKECFWIPMEIMTSASPGHRKGIVQALLMPCFLRPRCPAGPLLRTWRSLFTINMANFVGECISGLCGCCCAYHSVLRERSWPDNHTIGLAISSEFTRWTNTCMS